MRSVILGASSRTLVALLLVFSLYLLIRGHNEPGGGFAGGLLAATAFILYALAYGTPAARRAVGVPPTRLLAIGLAVALLSAI
ncbi:MAG TPA: MnhB domain-containing protein, partial [Candidatus Thermoplasmatota archaeon]|nr:MnhB domain-containing protein [Candidatus Thermoplasmatota archaeon]